jgi:O-antigen/teichoic acid export membrane protein
VAAQASTALLGYLYWLLVAHRWSASEVGAANTAMAGAVLCALVAGQGLIPAVLLAVPRVVDRQRPLIARVAVITATGLSLVVGATMLYITPLVVPSLGVILWSPHLAGWFIAAVVAQAAGTVTDAAAIAMRARSLMITRNVSVSIAKMALLAAVAGLHPSAPNAVLASAAIPGCASVLVCQWRIGRTRREAGSISVPGAIRTLARGVSWHYLGSLCAACPQYLLALIITMQLGAEQTAYFSMAWLLSTGAFMISPAVSQALLAEGADGDATGKRTALAIRVTALAVPLPVVALCAGGGLLLALFGRPYVGAWLALAVLALGCLPDSAANLACALLRIRGRLRTSALVNLTIAVLAGAGAWVVAQGGGIVAVAAVWGGSQLVGAVAAYVGLRHSYGPRRLAAALTPSAPANWVGLWTRRRV